MAEKTAVAQTGLRNRESPVPELRQLAAEIPEAVVISVAVNRKVGAVYFAEVRPELPSHHGNLRLPDMRRAFWLAADC